MTSRLPAWQYPVVLEFGVLGPLEVVRDGGPFVVPARRHRALLTRLVLGRGQVVPATELIAALWDEKPPTRASHALQVHVSRVRALLGSVGGCLVTQAPGYLLALPAEAVDAERFEDGLRRAAQLGPEQALPVLDEALALWRGPAYAEFADSFAQAVAIRLDELRITARERRAAALLAVGASDQAVSELSDLAAAHPLRERPHALLMRALHLAGRQPDALEVFRRFRDRLAGELGLDPSPALRELHGQVLRGEVTSGDARGGAPEAEPPPAVVWPAVAVAAGAVLARPMTSFVGREAELSGLARAIGEHHLVTLVGPGGVGKTRLVQELVARQATGGRPVAWIDLTSVQSPTDLPYRFIDALGLPEPADVRVEDFLVEALGAGPALVVADNCEHVIGAAAGMLERIAGSCPAVVVVATSREPLGVPGEQVLAVAPLPTPDTAPGADLAAPAVSLFVDRYRAAGGPPLAGDDLDQVAELCRRLDGLPLAIELAAARARSLGVAAVTERPLLDLLAGRRSGGDRHRSLRAVLDWSHDLLDSSERVLFRRLAAFTGWFSLAEAESVGSGGGLDQEHVAGALAGLVDRSMAALPGQHGRYRLLDTVRAYATERLAAHGEDLRTARTHAGYFVGFAEQAAAGMRGADEPMWIGRITDRLDELRTAFRWCCANDVDLALRLTAALAIYARFQVRFEMQDWAATAAALPGAAAHPLRPVVLASAAAGAWARDDFGRAEDLARQGLAAVPDDDRRAAPPLLALGDVALLEGRFADAIEAYQRAARLVGDSDPHLRCEALGGVALCTACLGDLDGARQMAATLLAEGRPGPPGAAAMAVYFAGETMLLTDPDQALDLLAEARGLAEKVNALFVIGFATVSLVSVRARAAASPVDGLAAYREAIEHWQRVGNRAQQWVTVRNLVPVLVRAGYDELACTVLGAVRRAPVRMPDDVPEAEALAAALGQARSRLPDGGASADQRGARITMEELLAEVLGVIGSAMSGRADLPLVGRRADQAAPSR
jgi:predicted ATPase/DNA-binding SARP family transcriptional activator